MQSSVCFVKVLSRLPRMPGESSANERAAEGELKLESISEIAV
ncbi:hypothetical protein HNQ79_002826 [Streptomyces candidus]|uniref:Uncharacterized protein n=1 Tax=Streptomyces candidus TaxID=67283 RepID=A0A7X0LPV0_9ACTN|nr:hypothetical protein [Streptomyces candidus]